MDLPQSADDGVFDVDALIRETAGEPFRFKYGDEVYECSPHFDIRAIAHMTTGALDEAFRLLLGAEQWERMMASDQVLSTGAFTAILARYAEHSGVDLPNLSAPTASSRPTVAPSKRTSSGITGRR